MKKINIILLFLVSMVTYSQNSDRPVEFVMIEIPPVYKGCEKEKSDSNRKACSSKLLIKHIDDNFDTAVSQITKLPAGQYNVYVSFVIDLKGDITDIKTKGNDYEPFVTEAARLIGAIPKYSTPGIQKGKQVKVRFTLPIAFIVETE
jgi:protein TonB